MDPFKRDPILMIKAPIFLAGVSGLTTIRVEPFRTQLRPGPHATQLRLQGLELGVQSLEFKGLEIGVGVLDFKISVFLGLGFRVWG